MDLDLEGIELMLLIAAVVAVLARRLHLPYTVGLTLAGIALAFTPVKFDLQLTKNLIFSAFLPPLIFETALNLDWRELRSNGWVVLILVTAGVLIAAGIVAAGLHVGEAWPWPSAAVLGLLISATDPVSVIATFKEAGVTGRLRLLVESESLFNDGIVAVLYGIALAIATGGGVSVGAAAVDLFRSVAGGIGCGAAAGGLVLLLAGRTQDRLVEITFSSIAAYGSFFVAEHFHFSGVLATLTAGILIGNTGNLGAFSDRGRDAVMGFWEYVGFVANSLIFLLIGARLVAQHVLGAAAVASLTVALVLVGRAVAVYVCCGVFARTRQRVSARHQHILVWGGLRGALALELARGLPADVPLHSQIVSVAFAVVAFSVLVPGLTMPLLLRRHGEIGEGRDPGAAG